MTDFLDRLEQQLIEAVERNGRTEDRPIGPRRPTRARWRIWRGRRQPIIVLLLAVVLVAGSATAAVLVLTKSRPLSGALARGPLSAARLPTRYRISVFPYMAVGWSGWCSNIAFQTRHGRTINYGGCGPVETSGSPFLAGGLFGGPGGVYDYEVLTDAVAAVRFSNGRTVIPRNDPRLPLGTRGLFAVFPPYAASRSGGTPVPPPNPPTEQWLDANGRVLPMPLVTRATAVERLQIRRINLRQPGTASCVVRFHALAGLTPLVEVVARPVPWPRRQPGAFLSCANATFRLAGETLAVAVLVDAADPARPAPPLPGLQEDNAHRGILIGRQLGNVGYPAGAAGLGVPFHTSLANRDISALRAGSAWLIAEGGTAAARAELLMDLNAVA
jgi:hypothetical protein